MSNISTFEPWLPDRRLARRRASRRAELHVNAEVIPNELADRLLDHLDPLAIAPARLLVLGSANGHVAARLAERFPDALLLEVDHALPMLRLDEPARERGRGWLRRARSRLPVCADAVRLPCADRAADLLVANLLLHWCGRADATLGEWARVLRPGAPVLFSTYGPDTLRELREALAEAGLPEPERFAALPDMHDVGDMLSSAGFVDPVMETERITLEYRSFEGGLADLRALAATNVSRGRPRGLLTPRVLDLVGERYESRRRSGTLPATLELVYGHAWRGTPKPPRPGRREVAFTPRG